MNPTNFYTSLSSGARIGLLSGIVAVVLLTAASMWWLLTPGQQLLFGNLREPAAAEIVQSLDEWKVPYEIGAGGSSITVAADVVHATRMKLVSAGVPRGGHVGFELFDDSDFGITEFAQRVNYQRALQGEIERTIATMPGVETARVHLTIRRPGLFVGERESSKASVALTLLPGESLSRGQVAGIRSLVASAVEGLGLESVSVLDSSGALLAAAGGAASGHSVDGRDDEEARMESRIQARVSDLLGQVLRNEEFRVSVDVLLNYDAVREVNERPIAQGDAGGGLLSRKRVNTSDAADSEGRHQSQEESEYVHGTAREEISRAPGRVERLSVAVILPQTLDEQQVARIHSLVTAAAGIDADRGDRLEVSRLGRQSRWITAPVTAEIAPPAVDDAQLATAHPAPPASLKWLPVLALGLLIGLVAAFAVQRRPRKLRQAEREAVLAKLRGWLADGNYAQ